MSEAEVPLPERVTFVVPGPAAGKARPRKGRGGFYVPQPKQYEARVAFFGTEAGLKPRGGAVEVSIVVSRILPKSWSNRKRDRMRGKLAETKPDLANIIASVHDGLTGVAYGDDSQVAIQSKTWKRWDDCDQTVITVAYGVL